LLTGSFQVGFARGQHQAVNAELLGGREAIVVELVEQAAERELDGVRVTTRVERRVADVVEPSRQLGIGDAKRVKAVTEPPSAPRRGATVTTDVDGDSLLHGLWIAASSLEGEVGALVCRLARGPQRS